MKVPLDALHPIVRDEVYRIGREAVVNAFRHAHAKTITVEVLYLENQLRLLISDDGCGINPEVLDSGREGHWGLSGMRERAERINARLKVRSRVGCRHGSGIVCAGRGGFQGSVEAFSKWFGNSGQTRVLRKQVKGAKQ